MTREELIELRNNLQGAVTTRRKLGDYDTNASPILLSLEASLALTQHLLVPAKK